MAAIVVSCVCAALCVLIPRLPAVRARWARARGGDALRRVVSIRVWLILATIAFLASAVYQTVRLLRGH